MLLFCCIPKLLMLQTLHSNADRPRKLINLLYTQWPIISCGKHHQISVLIEIKTTNWFLEANKSNLVFLNKVPKIYLAIASNSHEEVAHHWMKSGLIDLIYPFLVTLWLLFLLSHKDKRRSKSLLSLYAKLLVNPQFLLTLIKSLHCIDLSLKRLRLILTNKALSTSRKYGKLLRLAFNNTLSKVWVQGAWFKHKILGLCILKNLYLAYHVF